MRRVSIRDLSADAIRNSASDNEVLGVTSKGALVGVLVPLTPEILQRLALKDADELVAKAAEVDASGGARSDLRNVVHDSGHPIHADDYSRLSIREISGARLEHAASLGEPLVVTSDRVAVAVFLPLQSGWVDHVVEESVTRFLTGYEGNGPEAKGIEQSQTVRAEFVRSSGHRFSSQCVIGIRIVGDARFNAERIVGVVTDGLGTKDKVDPITLPLEQLDETYVFGQIRRLIDELSANMADSDDLIGVGIEIGGHVSLGRIVRSANIHWNQFPLATHLSETIGVPVVLENDANALAVYEQMQGISANDFAVILLTHLGVGCGMILDGRLYRGSRGMAGELGHIPIPAATLRNHVLSGVQPCRCGNPDCLEGLATPHAIELALQAKGFSGSYEDARRQSHDPLVRDVFAEAGRGLGYGITTVLNMINPETVVIYGPMDLVGPPRQFHIDNFDRVTEAKAVTGVERVYTDALIDSVRCHTFSNAADECQFIVRIRDDATGAKAAAACVIRAIRDRSAIGRLRQSPTYPERISSLERTR